MITYTVLFDIDKGIKRQDLKWISAKNLVGSWQISEMIWNDRNNFDAFKKTLDAFR